MVVRNPNDNVWKAISEETGMKNIIIMFGENEVTINDTFIEIGIENGGTLMVLKQKNLTVFVRTNCFSNSVPRTYDVDDSQEIEQTLRDEMDIPVDILIDNDPINDHSTFANYANYKEIEEIEDNDPINREINSINREMNSINREMNIKVITDGNVECYHEEKTLY